MTFMKFFFAVRPGAVSLWVFLLVLPALQARHAGAAEAIVSAARSGSLSVRAENSQPSFGPIPLQTGPMNTAKIVNFTVQDADDVNAVTLTAESSDTGLVPPENIVFGGTGTNRTATITPLPDKFGLLSISMVANDGSGTDTSTARVHFQLRITPTATGGISVNGFSPAVVKEGDTVTISGQGLIGPEGPGYSATTIVWFPQQVGQSAPGWSPVYPAAGATGHSLQAVVPAYTRTGRVTVTADSYNAATGVTTRYIANSTVDLTVTAFIADFSPKSGEVGQFVSITGSGFTSATQVRFNGVPATVAFFGAENSVSAYVPEGATTGKISIVTSDVGTAVSAVNFLVGPPDTTAPSVAVTSPEDGAITH